MGLEWWLLGLGLLSLSLSLNARFPVRRFGGLSIVSFFAGWLTTELALHHLVVQIAAAGALIFYGALSQLSGSFEPVGWIGALLLVVSWAQLLRLHRRAQLAATALDNALDTLRAPGIRAEISQPTAAEAVDEAVAQSVPSTVKSTALGLLEVVRPFAVRHREVRVERRQYAEHGGRKLFAHVYFRGDKPANAPVLVFAHGGGWVVGFKRFQALPMLNQLASQGWVCVSLDYRLAPRATFPEPLVDLKRGIAWVKQHVNEWGGSTRFVALSGNSAGAHLSALAALTWDKPELQPGFEQEDTRVDACIPFYGVFDLLNQRGQWKHRGVENLMRFIVIKQSAQRARAQYELMSPITHIRPDAPPFFVIHGDSDSLVPTAESRHFSEALRTVSDSPVLYAEIPDAQHAFEIFKSIRGVYAVRAVAAFLDVIRARAEAEQVERARAA